LMLAADRGGDVDVLPAGRTLKPGSVNVMV
jgi:hypothetical protein